MEGKGYRKRHRHAGVLVALALASMLLALAIAGCGLQTDEANQDLVKANAHQQAAEAVIARLKALPGDWQNIFAGNGANATTVAQAQQLVQARQGDLDTLDKALKDWAEDNAAILKLNVEEKVKEYVKLKRASIKNWQEYSTSYLRPLVKGYETLLQTIAAGRPVSEQQKAAADITNLTSESISKLQECLNTEKQAEEYFKTNNLGK